jgi:plasmid stabilization system protein ParE
MKSIITHPEAQEEHIQAVQTYEQKRSGLGSRFHKEIRKLITEIQNNPSTFRYIRGHYRRHFSGTFPYAVIYEDKPGYIHIVAIAHMHRRPYYWMDRTTSG